MQPTSFLNYQTRKAEQLLNAELNKNLIQANEFAPISYL